jgi:hypothetical protein
MTGKAFVFAGLVLLITMISMFYSGMFMHGD